MDFAALHAIRRRERLVKRWFILPMPIVAVSGGWATIISNLKSLLETGSTVLRDPYPTGNQR